MRTNTWLVGAYAITLLTIFGAQGLQAEQPVSQGGTYVRDGVLEQRDFPLLTAMESSKEVAALMESDAALRQIDAERWESAKGANRDCKEEDIACKAAAIELNPALIAKISAALGRVYDTHAEMREFVRRELAPAAVYSLDGNENLRQRLTETWVRTAAQLNETIATYGLGVAPRYKQIDSITYTASSQSWAALIEIIVDGLPLDDNATEHEGLFFEPAMRFAVRLLQANSRDEAGRFWPLEAGENKAAVARAAGVDWAKYAYSAIVIPGAGSEIAGVRLSPWAKERLRLGVAAFRAGKAPFLLVTGGFVHPAQTPWCEAVEMKRYLMEVYEIPESAILIDPYARHTTTNLRNATREILGYGLPARKAMLVVSDTAQIDYILGPTFVERCKSDLGYVPVDGMKRLSPTELEVRPSMRSLFRDASDPLDP